jgi:hypothetical protein
MVALRTTFDGERIAVPPELKGAAPGEVLVVYLDKATPPEPLLRPSIWDSVGKAPQQRSAEQIISAVRADRDSWGER